MRVERMRDVPGGIGARTPLRLGEVAPALEDRAARVGHGCGEFGGFDQRCVHRSRIFGCDAFSAESPCRYNRAILQGLRHLWRSTYTGVAAVHTRGACCWRLSSSTCLI